MAPTAYDHPFERVLLPPEDETESERIAREEKEKAEKATSDEIDLLLRTEREEQVARVKRGTVLKILLLGQSESGKSTLLKNFQMLYSPKIFRRERSSWKPIIYLNLVRNVRTVLDQLTAPLPEDLDAQGRLHHPSRSRSTSPKTSPVGSRRASPIASPDRRILRLVDLHDGATWEDDEDADLLRLHQKLYPIITDLEESLIRKINPTWYEFYQRARATGSENDHGGTSLLKKPFIQTTTLTVNAVSSWKAAFLKGAGRSEEDVDDDVEDYVAAALRRRCGEIEILWKDTRVQNILERRNLRLEETGGFFLDSIKEICSPNYVPSDDHVLRARIKTVGVTEHHFEIETGHYWRVFDVGGHRSLRAAWVPYFDDVDWILFLVPISAFDQVLEEAPKVNRLEDSVNLWKYLVSNRLLLKASIILFLNKMDIMKSKLESGIKLKNYVVSYGDERPNDVTNCCAYVKKKFAGIMHDKSPVKRQFYCHLTTVTDIKSTALVLKSIQDRLLRHNLRSAQLLS